MGRKGDLDGELDRLYGGPPEEFVAARDALATEMKSGSRADEAKGVKKLRRPSQAAALVNWLSRERADEVAALAKTAASMRDPATAGDGKKLRAAVKAERESVRELLAAAGEEVERRGGGGRTSATLDRVGETLRALTTDADLERAVLAGRLEREGEASTIGFELTLKAGAEPAAKPGGKGKGRGKGRAKAEPKPDLKAERATLAQLERHAEAAEERLGEASARVESAEVRLAAARGRRAAAEAELKSARGEVRKQERRIAKLAGD